MLEFIQSTLGFGVVVFPEYRPNMAVYSVARKEELGKLKAIFDTHICSSNTLARFGTLLGVDNKLSAPTLQDA